MSYVKIVLRKSLKYVINNNIENNNLKYVVHNNSMYIFKEIYYI